MFARRHWIPPGGLIFAQASHGLSWLLLVWIAAYVGIENLSAPALAWLHIVALGWATVAALSILLHVIPGFTGLKWRFERLARTSLAVFAVGVGAFVLNFLITVKYVGITAAWIFIALLCYVAVAWITLAQGRYAERTERAIARAISITLLMLVAVAALGLMLSFFLAGNLASDWIARLPAAHANLGFYGWLSLLIYGVSARTVRPICGAGSRFVWIHTLVAMSTLVGAPILAVGLGFGNAPLSWLGAGLLGLGALIHIANLGDILARATIPHRPPQTFIAASAIWLLVAMMLGAATLAGRPLALAYGFVVLIGWVGQMVNAHTFHIGVRLIATVYRGDDDETQPIELLDPRLSWLAFGGMQIAIALCAFGMGTSVATYVAIGAIVGFCAWCAIAANLAIVRSRSKGSRVMLSLG